MCEAEPGCVAEFVPQCLPESHGVRLEVCCYPRYGCGPFVVKLAIPGGEEDVGQQFTVWKFVGFVMLCYLVFGEVPLREVDAAVALTTDVELVGEEPFVGYVLNVVFVLPQQVLFEGVNV